MSELHFEAASLSVSEALSLQDPSSVRSLQGRAAITFGKARWLDYTTYRAQRYMPALDGLRGVAVALVITRHLHRRMWDFLSGSVGVTIFFLLSGYLITRLALEEERTRGRLDLTAFYLRRSFRIFPMYYFVLALYALLILGTHGLPAKAATFPILLPYYLSYLQELPVWGLVHLPTGDLPFYQTWSLGIEEKFYLVWPILLVAVGVGRYKLRLGITLLIAFACTLQGITVEGRRAYSLESYVPILLGVALAFALSESASYDTVTTWARRLTPAAVAVALLTQFVLMPHTHVRGLFTLYAAAATVLLVFVLSARSWISRLLSTPALTFLGRISYGVYLLHILCLVVVERVFRPERGVATGVLAYVFTLLFAAAFAYLLHISFERPLVQMGRRLSRRHILAEPATVLVEVSGEEPAIAG